MLAVKFTSRGISFAWNLFVGVLLSLLASWIVALVIAGVITFVSTAFRLPLPVKFWTIEEILHVVLFFVLVRDITGMCVEDDIAEWKKLQKEEERANARRATPATPTVPTP
jgi:hypothetical protein